MPNSSQNLYRNLLPGFNRLYCTNMGFLNHYNRHDNSLLGIQLNFIDRPLTRFCGRQYWLSKQLQVCNYICGSRLYLKLACLPYLCKTWLAGLQPALRQCLLHFYRPSTAYAVQCQIILNTYKLYTDSAVIKPCSASLHMHSAGLTIAKICIAIRYRHSSANAVFKTSVLSLYRLSTGFAIAKTGMPILYTL